MYNTTNSKHNKHKKLWRCKLFYHTLNTQQTSKIEREKPVYILYEERRRLCILDDLRRHPELYAYTTQTLRGALYGHPHHLLAASCFVGHVSCFAVSEPVCMGQQKGRIMTGGWNHTPNNQPTPVEYGPVTASRFTTYTNDQLTDRSAQFDATRMRRYIKPDQMHTATKYRRITSDCWFQCVTSWWIVGW
jgi:hypothetical protein